MKIIDEKGRLLGKINVIDFLVILFLLFLAPAFYFGYEILVKRPVVIEQENELIETEMDCRFIIVKPELEKIISVGDKELDEKGNTIAEILSLGKIESSNTAFDLGRGNLVKGEDKSKKQISARMRLKCEVRGGNQLYFKGKKVEYNKPFEFKTDKYEIIGLSSHREKWMSLRVKFSRVVPEIAEVVKKGDIEKDAFGKIIARIGSIISNELALVTTVDELEDKFLTLRHPFERDITAFLEVLCVEKEGSYYFKNDLAKMGNELKFITDLYSVSGLIMGIRVK